MESLSYSDLITAKELNDKFLSGDEINGERIYSGIMAGKCLSNMIFPHLGDMSCFVTHGAIFENVVFNRIDFLGTNLGLTKFYNCIFDNCNIIKADFFESKFKNTVFSKCKLLKSTLIKVDVQSCIFTNNNLDRILLSESKITNTIFTGETDPPTLRDNDELNVIWNIRSPV